MCAATIVGMILITGATGTVGSHVRRLLVTKGEPVRAMTRNPDKIPPSIGVEVVQADFDDPASLQRAVVDVETVFLLTAPKSPTPRHDFAMLEAARSAGVGRIVKLSAIGTGEKINDNAVGHWHQLAEQAVRTSGMAWTLLRPSSFASNVLAWVGPMNAGDLVPNMTGTGTQGIIDPRDVAAVAVEILRSPVHTGQVYTLTGPELLSVTDQAAMLAKVLGRPVRTVEISLGVAREQMLASGLESSVVDLIITGAAWVRAGRNAILTEDVARILGHRPTNFETWAADHRDVFTNT